MRQFSMIPRKRKIAVLFPVFLSGGAEAVCVWILEALKRDFDVTLITFSAVNFEMLNSLFGTSLTENEVQIVRPFAGTPIPQSLFNGYFGFTFRLHLLMRYLKAIQSQFDVVFSTFGEMDLGGAGIQYVHFPVVGKGHEKAKKLIGYSESTLKRLNRWLCRVISDYSDESMKRNLTITNSNWTAGIIKEIYGIDSRIVYPPVSLKVTDVPWEEREDGFVCIGRLVPEKRIEKAIENLKAVRLRGFDVHLHIISSGGDPRYEARILDLLRQNQSWIFLEKGLSREKLGHLLSRHRYGIHMTENEQFGIAVAEMVKARCIPFVPSSGGQVEIVGGNNWLTFCDQHQAVEKIINVISDEGKQQYICKLLLQRAELFGVGIFQQQIRNLISSFFESQNPKSFDVN